MNASSSSANSGCAARPSIVVTSRPSACTASVQHALTGSPSSSTVQAPHTWTSHERLAPVRSRRVAQEVEQQLLGRHVADDRGAVDAQLEVHARIPRAGADAPGLADPGRPVLGDELVPVLVGDHAQRRLGRDRLQRAVHGGDRLQLRRALERRGRKRRPGHVLARHEHAVIAHQQRPVRAERGRDGPPLLGVDDRARARPRRPARRRRRARRRASAARAARWWRRAPSRRAGGRARPSRHRAAPGRRPGAARPPGACPAGTR